MARLSIVLLRLISLLRRVSRSAVVRTRGDLVRVQAAADPMALVEDLLPVLLQNVFILASAFAELACAPRTITRALLTVGESDLITASLIVDYVLIAFVFLMLKYLNLRVVRTVG